MALSGKGGSVKSGANIISAIANWKLDINSDLKDSTNFQSNGWKENTPTLKSWNASFDGQWNVNSDANGQKALQDAQLNSTMLTLDLSLDGVHKYSGNSYIKKLNVEDPVDDIIKFSCEVEGTGPVAYT